MGILDRFDVTIGDQWDGGDIAHGADRVPIGASLVNRTRVRPWIVTSWTPASCTLCDFGALIEFSSQPSRILSVTGTSTVLTVASIRPSA